MCKKLKSIALLSFISLIVILFTQNLNAQWLYYPADAFSTLGVPSTLITPPTSLLPGILPFNLFYPNAQPPGLFVFPPAPIFPWSIYTAPTLTPTTAAYNLAATVLYYPANAFSTLGTPSTVVAPPAPVGISTLPFNLFYPNAVPPATYYYPPAPVI